MWRAKPRRKVAGVLASMALATTIVGCRSPGAEPPSVEGLNLLLVTLDTLRADRLGAYGYERAATPVVDSLAHGGVRFADVTAAAPLTLPSHATLLSGRLPPHHGLRHNGLGRFPEELETLATRLGGAGYATAAFVGAFVLDRRFGLARGFDLYDDAIERPDAGQPLRLEAERPAGEVVDRAAAWIVDKVRGEKRFFVWVHLYDAHAPYDPPEPWASQFAERPYDGEIAYLDSQIGRLLEALANGGTARQTVVAVVGDHGEALGEHGEKSHGLLLYEAVLRVPWILSAPGVLPLRVVETPVSVADVGPTLAGLLGQNLGGGDSLGGRDLSEALLDGVEPEPRAVYSETEYPALFGWAGLAAVRRGSLKLIVAPRPELYDVMADPAERRDLARERRRELRDLEALVEELRRDGVENNAAPDAETRRRLAALGYAGALPARASAARPDPKDRMDLYNSYEHARRALETGALTTAVRELERLASADPGNPVFRGSLALAYRRSGKIERAVEHYRETAALAPLDPDAWQNLAAALREAGHMAAALEAAKEALRLDAERPETRNLLGLVHLAEGRTAQARRELEKALELDGDNAAVWNNLGNVLRAQKELPGAEAAYRRAGDLAPRWADPLNGLGALLVELDRAGEARACFDRALVLDPDFHEARFNRAIAFEVTGEREEAIAAYREFLALSAGSPELVRQREAATALLTRISD